MRSGQRVILEEPRPVAEYRRCYLGEERYMIGADLLDYSGRRTRPRLVRKVWKPNNWFPSDRISWIGPVATSFYRRDDIVWPIISREESEADLTGTIQKKLKIRKKDAAAVKERLYEEIDRIVQDRNVEQFSSTEKDQLILAIIKTADSLLKKTLSTK